LRIDLIVFAATLCLFPSLHLSFTPFLCCPCCPWIHSSLHTWCGCEREGKSEIWTFILVSN